VFCNDVCSIMEVLGHEYNPDQWHLFIDLSKEPDGSSTPQWKWIPFCSFGLCGQHEGKLQKHEATVGKDKV